MLVKAPDDVILNGLHRSRILLRIFLKSDASGMTVSAFVKRNANVKGVAQGFIAFISTLGGLWYVCDTLVEGGDPLHPLLWACTVTLFGFVVFGLFSYCAYAQFMMQDEIDRITKIKEELEGVHLKRRLSSVGERV